MQVQDGSTGVATGAVSAAARAWVATGGNPQAFLTSLVQHLGAASATRRATFAGAALTSVARGATHASHKGVASVLVTFARVLLTAPFKAVSKKDSERSNYMMSEDDAFATLSGSFQQFAWQPRLDALRKLLKYCVDKKTRGTAALGPRILRVTLQQVAAVACAPAGELHSNAVQKALKGVFTAALNVQAALLEVCGLHAPVCLRHACTTALVRASTCMLHMQW